MVQVGLYNIEKAAISITFKLLSHLMLKKLLVIVILLIVVLIGYYAIVLFKARKETPAIVDKALHSVHIKLQLSDLSERQKQILLAVQDPNFQ
jgi:hypothetical protein